MSLINVKNLTFSYDTGFTNVFENVSFQINTDWKLGFIGRNGRGKTTFLKLLTGKYEYGGTISTNVNFLYFPFEVRNENADVTDILFEICPAAQEWEMMRELSLLDVCADALYRPYSSLSGGEQTKVLLAGLFLSENGFPLIDEPTNHLDRKARQCVSKYLQSKKGFILVSHDRAFLDGCIDHVLSINKTDIEIQSGNFTTWLKNYEYKQTFELTQNEKLKKDIERLDEASKRSASWANKTEKSKYGKTSAGLKPDKGYVGHKAAKMMKSAKVTQERRNDAIKQKSQLLKNTETNEDLKIFPLTHRSETLISLSDVEIFYGERKICSPENFSLYRGDRIALDGKNGSGKSSLLKLINGENVLHSGTVNTASGLIISYLPQHVDGMRGSLSEYAKSAEIPESLFKAILHKTDFPKKDFDADISAYSAGQKRKVLLAESLCKKAHVYIWDEPLNYIDVFSRMQIENLIKEFKPTMIFVEHDEAFRNAIATKTVRL